MKPLIALICLAFSQYALAQNTHEANVIFKKTISEVDLSPDFLMETGLQMLMKSKQAENETGLIQGRILIAKAHFENNQLDTAALSLLEMIPKLETENKNSFELGHVRNLLGRTFYELKDWKNALSNFERSRDIFQLTGSLSLSTAISNIGTVYHRQNKLEDALRYYNEAEELANVEEAPYPIRSMIKRNIAVALYLQNKIKPAVMYATNALAMDLKTDNKVGIPRDYVVLGSIYGKGIHIADSAFHYFELAIKHSDPTSECFSPMVNQALDGIWDSYSREGNYNKVRWAIGQVKNKVPVYSQAMLFNLFSRNALNIHALDSSIFYAHKVLSQGNIDLTLSRDAYQQLYQSFQQKGNIDSSFFYFQRFHHYQDSIEYASNERKYNNLRLDLISIENDRKVELMQQSQMIDRLRNQLIVSFLSGILILISVLFYRRYKKQVTKQKELQETIEKNSQQLTSHTLSMVHRNNGFQQIEEEVDKMLKSDHFNPVRIKKIISMNKSGDNDWENFDSYFGHVHNGFGEQLLKEHPEINVTEQRLAFLIKMKLTNREIASILHIEPRSVSMAKYRLKKKLGIPEEQDLSQFLTSF